MTAASTLKAVPPPTKEEYAILRARCVEVMDQACTLWDLQGLKVTLKLDLRGKCAGRAGASRTKGTGLIRLNIEAYRLDPKDMLEDTIPHEIAHIVAGWTGLGRGHDAGWRRIAIRLGSTGKRCHSLELTPARKTRRFAYQATCGTTVEVGPRRHSSIQLGKRYTVRRTGGAIKKDGFLGQCS